MMLHAFMHAHILKAFYALWHIIVWFAGGAESRRAELDMFLECLFSIAHFYLTAVSQSRMVVHGGKLAAAIMSVFGLFFSQ